MHMIALLEANDRNGFENFEEWLRSKKYTFKHNGEEKTVTPIMNEVKLVDIKIQEQNEEELLRDLLPWSNPGHMDKEKLNEFRGFLCDMTEMEPVLDVKNEDRKEWKILRQSSGADFNDVVYCYPLGKIKDDKQEDDESVDKI